MECSHIIDVDTHGLRVEPGLSDCVFALSVIYYRS